MKLLAFLVRNWPLKLAALVLSLLVWVLVSAEETRSQLVDVQVDLGIPPSMALATALPTVRALVSGPGRDLVKLHDTPLAIQASMPAGAVPRWHLVIVPADVRVPASLSITVTDVQPRELLVDVDHRATRAVPVALRGSIAPRRGWSLDSLALEPVMVQVSGARVLVATLDSVPTEPLDAGAVDSAFHGSVAVDTAGYPLLRFTPARVTVTARHRPRP